MLNISLSVHLSVCLPAFLNFCTFCHKIGSYIQLLHFSNFVLKILIYFKFKKS
jgi:hypothetical protein